MARQPRQNDSTKPVSKRSVEQQAVEKQPAELGRQAAKSLATREKVVNAVIELINEKGFAAASSSQIARRAGVTWGAVQHHFDSKQAILEVVLERSSKQFHATFEDEHFATGSAKKRVDEYVDIAWQHYQGPAYMATVEILLASRGENQGPGEIATRVLKRDYHIALGRRIFHDSDVSDQVMQEAIYMVHVMLTGVLIEQVLEPAVFETEIYLAHLKRIVLAMLYPGLPG